jgi:hypothetical protein
MRVAVIETFGSRHVGFGLSSSIFGLGQFNNATGQAMQAKREAATPRKPQDQRKPETVEVARLTQDRR